MTRFYLLACTAILATASGLASHAQDRMATTSPGAQDSISPATATCDYPFGSGNLLWCVSLNGNLTKLTSPAGVQIFPAAAGVNNEGYGLCHSGGSYWSLGWYESGFGPPTLVAKTTTGVTINRTTTDGLFTVSQKWTRDLNERDVTVTMKVTSNLNPKAGVKLVRFGDVGLDGDDLDDRYDGTPDTLWARDVHGVSMSSRLTFAHTPVIGDTILSNCMPASAAVLPGGPGQARFSYRQDIGNMNAGQSKTAYFIYRAE